jgi:hypothetical protein
MTPSTPLHLGRNWLADGISQRRTNWRENPLFSSERSRIPTPDGYRLPSNIFNGTAQRDLIDILQRRYARQEDVGVFGDLIIKWGIEGLEERCPDVCVVFELKNKVTNTNSKFKIT